MILVTGGAGFIGTHVVDALRQAGEDCVIVHRSPRQTRVAPGEGDAHVARADVNDFESLSSVGARFPITGIIHLAGSMPWPVTIDDPVEAARRSLGGFFNIVRVAQQWNVRRVVAASTIGVYGGIEQSGALGEDLPLPPRYLHVIPTFKKISELLGSHLNQVTDVQIIQARISGTWGPGGHVPDPFFPASALAYAAARGITPDFSGIRTPPRRGDALDLSYVEDTGRALALLHAAEHLNHTTYNVGAGHATTNAEVIEAIRTVVPGFDVNMPDGDSGHLQWLDTTRLIDDTGYRPRYDTAAAAADYIRWFRDGRDR